MTKEQTKLEKWEQRYDRFLDWIFEKTPAIQALIFTVLTILVITLGVALILGVVFFIVKVLGWWTMVVVPTLILYLKFYYECYESKKRGY